MATFNVTNDAEFEAALLLGRDGDTINLAAGNYSAEHNINHDITIKGAMGNTSELSGGIDITHAGVTIDGVSVTGSSNFSDPLLTPTGINITAAGTGVTIKNTLFDNGGASGAVGLTTNATGLTVAHSEFAGYNNGIYLVASATGSIHDNVFTEAGGSIGIQTESTGVLISHNTFNDAGAGGAAVFSTPTGSTNGAAFVLADNHVQPLSAGHAVNIDVSGTGAFTVNGTAFDDAIYTADDPGHVAALILNGLGGNDEIWGGAGNDTLTGGAGNDILHGQGGDDTFGISGTTDTFDTFDGGSGTDRMLVTEMKGVTLNGFNATADSVETWAGNGHELLGTAAAETFDLTGLTTVTGLTFLDGGVGNDVLSAPNSWNSDLRGNIGDDTLNGGTGSDTLAGGAGTDTLHGGAGNDKLVLSGSGDQNDVLDGGANTDTVQTSGAVTLHGFNATVDSIEAWAGTKNAGVNGTDVGDTFNLSGLTAVTNLLFVNGGAGNDTITGSNAWNGDLRGGLGSDTLHGGTGNDTLDGGKDKVSDGFVFNLGDGHDKIVNFIATKIPSVTDDHIDLTGFGTNYTTDVHNHMTASGNNVVIDFGGGDMLTIQHTTISFLDAHSADFHLA